jgi:hypothetical protein
MKMMTEDTKQWLLSSSIQAIEEMRIQINLLVEHPKVFNISKELSQFDLFIKMLLCDCNVVMKLFCQANQRWEQIFLVKQIYTMMNESTKKIIGYPPNSSKSTYWEKIVKPFAYQNEEALLNEYELITEMLKTYSREGFQTEISRIRNLVVHHEETLDTITLFKEINGISVEETFQLLIKWVSLIERIVKFLNKCYFVLYNIKIQELINLHKSDNTK